MTPPADDLKRAVGQAASARVRDGMVLGLGTGSTAAFFLEAVGGRIRSEGLDLLGVPTSHATEALARRHGIPLTTLQEHPRLDLAVDGADEVTPALDATKGMGGALLREKVVAAAAREFVLIIDESKWVDQLGVRSAVPVEVLPFSAGALDRALEDLKPQPRLSGGRPFVTDNGNHVLDLHPGPIADPAALARRLEATPGVLEHGLFLGLAREALVARGSGEVQARRKPAPGSAAGRP